MDPSVKSKTSAEEVKEEVGETAESIGEFTQDKMSEYQRKVEAKLQTLNQKHEEL